VNAGDRFEIRADYAHTGTQGGFTVGVSWSGTQLVSRVLAAAETVLVTRAEVAAGQWSATTWGGATAAQSGAGALLTGATPGQAVTITFTGSAGLTGSDIVGLTSYTVLRYRRAGQ
jgi:hypothetical protein